VYENVHCLGSTMFTFDIELIIFRGVLVTLLHALVRRHTGLKQPHKVHWHGKLFPTFGMALSIPDSCTCKFPVSLDNSNPCDTINLCGSLDDLGCDSRLQYLHKLLQPISACIHYMPCMLCTSCPLHFAAASAPIPHHKKHRMTCIMVEENLISTTSRFSEMV
jgi:hypothetical protein